MFTNLLKSVLHNIGVLVVGFAFAFLGTRLDWLLGLHSFEFIGTTIAAWLLLAMGFGLRVWATYDFYQRQMKVIVLKPQTSLITTGPYRFTRNPLYLGGNLFIFGGAVLWLGSPGGLILTVVVVIATDFMIRQEEKQLEKTFGLAFIRYKSRVRRWI
jgi:protein-S-isoprenylcysteine O-methyltransferase Ste14